MKKIVSIKSVFILQLLLCSISFSQSNWIWQNPKPQQNNLKSVFPVDSNIVVSVGECGMIIRTSNGGNTWNIYQTTDTNNLNSVFFINSNTGWIAGGNYTGSTPSTSSVYKTTDAGLNWMSIDLGFPDNMLTCVFFVNSQTGYMGGGTYNSGWLYKTTNGGLNWSQKNFEFSHLVNTEYFINENTGWVTYNNAICRTTDGGENWLVTTTSPGSQSSIVFLDNMNGFYSCGTSYRTTNGGVNWQNISVYGMSVCFTNQLTGWIGGASNPTRVYKTTDGGISWTPYNCQTGNQVLAVRFLNSSVGWAVGWYGTIQKTTNGGLNWFDQLGGVVIKSVYSGCFLNSNTGYIAGGEGYFGSVAKTTDGGANWNMFFQGNALFRSVCFVNENYGWLCGYGYTTNITGKIFNTSDGGLNWNLQYSMLIEEYNDIKFLDINTGFVFGYNVMGGGGKVMKTTNGGVNWVTTYLQGNNTGCYKSYFIDANTGWLGCSGGGLFRTTDCGATWINIPTSLTESISSVRFLNLNTGFAGGLTGGMYKTTNGGTTWSGNRTTMYMINDITFIDNNTGWAGSGAGELLYTTNQGNLWKRYPHLTNNGIASIPFVNQSTGYLVGGDGMVLKTTNCGGLLSVTQTGQSIPEKFSLSQNYPNPFNPVTKLRFDIPAGYGRDCSVKIVICDILGCQVAALVNEQLKPGSYEVEWDASDFSSGIYFYRVEAGDYFETKKMVLIK